MKKTLALLLSFVLLMQPFCGALAAGGFMLPSGLKTISEEAFAGDTSITGVITLPEMVETVGKSAFAGTDVWGLKLTENTKEVGSGVLAGAGANYVVAKSADTVFQDGALKDVNVLVGPAALESQRGDAAFYPSDEVEFEDGFAYWMKDDHAVLIFASEEKSGEIEIPNKVKDLPVLDAGRHAFSGLDGVTKITLPLALSLNIPTTGPDWPEAEFETTGGKKLALSPSSVTMAVGEWMLAPKMLGLPGVTSLYDWTYKVSEGGFVLDEEGVENPDELIPEGTKVFVDGEGTITALEPGKVTIQYIAVAKDTTYFGDITVTVTEPQLIFEYEDTTMTIEVGQSGYLPIEIGSTAHSVAVNTTYVSDKTDIVSIDDGGRLWANALGTANVTVTATLPGIGNAEKITETATFTVNVTEPQIQFQFQSLYTYTGWSYDMKYLEGSEPAEGAAVVWKSADSSIATVDEKGHVEILKTGETTLTCEITEGETVRTATIPVYVRENPHFTQDVEIRDGLIADWEYHPFWESLQPKLSDTLWPHDEGALVISATSEDANVMKFDYQYRYDEYKNREKVLVAYAGNPGETTVTYSVGFSENYIKIHNNHGAYPPAADTDSFTVRVRAPEMEVEIWTDEDVLQFGTTSQIHYRVESESFIENVVFKSSNPDVISVDPEGKLLATGGGKATITMTVYSFGTSVSASTEVTVLGYALKFEPAEITIKVGETVSVAPTWTLPDGSHLGNDGAGFVTDNESIAVVDYIGRVTGMAPGSVGVHIETYGIALNEDGEYETTDERVRAYMTVHVVEDDPQLILKNEEGKAVSFVEIYPNVPYALDAYDAAGKKVENVEWTVSAWSDPEGRATVKDGFVTLHYDWADESEYVYVTATAEVGGETVSATCAFNALRPVLSIGDYFGYYRLENGESTQFEYHVFKGEGAPAHTVELLSENPELVKADTVLNTITACEEGSGVTTVHAILKADGKEVGRVSSIVHVNSDLPTGEEITSFGPVNERRFFLPDSWAWIGRSITPDTYWTYFNINVYSDNEDVVEVHGDDIHTVGEGTANLIYELYSYEDPETAIERLEVPVTVGYPKANVTITRGELGVIQVDDAGDRENPVNLETGDIVKITGVLPDNADVNIWWDWDRHHLQKVAEDESSITFNVVRPTENTEVWMQVDLHDYEGVEVCIPFAVDGEEFPILDQSAIIFGVNEFAHIWPQFDHEGRYELNGEWYGYELTAEDPEIVEIVDPEEGENAWDNPRIKGLKVGETTVTGRYLVNTNDPENPDDDEYVNISIPVTVLDPVWTLLGMGCPSVMLVGDSHDPQVWWDDPSRTTCGEEYEFTFSEDGIVAFDEDEWAFVALKPGKVTVTCTMTRGNGQQSVSREITVIDPSLRFAEDNYTLDQGSSKLLRLIDKTGKKISAVYYSFKNPLWFDIELDSDKDLTPYITAKEGVVGYTLLTAKVAYDDDTTAVASTYIHIQDEPYIDVWMDEEYDGEIEMHVIQTDIHELRAVEARMDTNLHNVTESFVSSNPEVVTVSSQGALLKHKPGEAIITYTASAGDISASVDVKVIVTGWEISLYPTEIEMTPGEAVFVTPDLHLEDGRELDFNPEQGWYYTTNEDVAYVDHEGLVTALAPGKTSVSYSYEVEEGTILYARTEVTVNPDIPKDEAGEPVAKPLTITLKNAEGKYVPVTKTTIKPRQTLELGIEHDGKLTGEINWSSSDGNISFYEGNIARLDTWDIYGSYCTFYIRCDAEIDGEMQTAYLLLEYLQTQATLISPPNFYEVSVGQNAQVEWSYTVADPSMTIKPVFSIVDPAIALVDNRGIISGITPGVTMVRLDLYDAETNEWLTSGAAYVYVDTPIPAPDFAFGQPFYYFDLTSDNRDYEQGIWFEDPQGTLVFYDEVHFASDNEDIVEIDEHGTMHAHNPGETTIRAWVDGYEDKAATAEVLVAEPYLTADKEQNEDGVYQMKVGELITFTMHDVPDADNELYPLEEIYRDLQSMHVVDMKHEGTEITITAFARKEDYIDGHIGASFPNRGIEFRLNVNIDPVNGDYRFGEETLTAVVGETITLWPNFEWDEIASTTVDNEDVLELLEGDEHNPIRFTAKNPGKATLSAEVLPSDAESEDDTVTITATVLVSEDDTWDLESLDGIPDIMMVGVHYHDVWAGIRYNGYYWPHTTWAFGDDSLIEVIQNEDEEPYFLPLKAGTTTLTVTVEKDGEVQSMEKTITIVDPFVRFIWTGASLRPGQALYAPLSISPKLLRDVVSIEFTVDDENIVQVNGPYRYNGYTHTAEIIPVADKGVTLIHASVGLKDGTVYSASMPVFITENKDVWLNVHDGYDMNLSTRPWGNEPMRDSVWVHWDTNAALTTDGGADYIRIEWSDYDDGVIRVVEGDQYNNGVFIEALREGETGLTAHITLYDRDDNVIGEGSTHFHVNVWEPWIETSANRDHVEVRVNEGEHISFEWRTENFAPITRRVLRSEDENIARINTDDHVYGVHPGETKIYCDYYSGEYIVATHEVPVTVVGAEIYIGPNDMTIEVGQSYYIGELVKLNGLEDHGFDWRSTNPAAAAISANGLVYGVAPGEAQIHGIQNTNDGEFVATASVRVVGEAPAFALSANALTLYPEQSYTFEFGDNVDLDTLYWEISTDDGDVEFNEHTLTVTALDNTDREKFAVLTFTAKVDGVRQTASCHITLPERRLVIKEHQFGEGRWQYVNTGDTMGVHEQYVCTDPSLRVDVEIWTDNPGVLYWSDYAQVFYAISEGETTAYYKVTASNGESYTRSMFVRVSDEYTFFPTSIAPEHADHAYVVNLDWREGGFPIINTPEYTGCDMEFTSSDDGVVFFDENDTMYYKNPGRVTVTAKAAEGEPVDFGEVQGEVLVLDPERIQLVAYDSEGNPVDTVIPGQTVQLGFIAEDGGVLWEEKDVERVEYINYYGDFHYTVTEDGKLTRNGIWDGEFSVQARVQFKSGLAERFECKLFCDATNRAFAHLVMDNPDEWMPYHVNFVGERSAERILLMYSDRVLGNLTDLRWESTDESIAKVVRIENEGEFIQCGDKPGKAIITAHATFESGAQMSDTFEVTVLKPTTLEIGFSANLPHGANVVQVGDIIELYTWFEDEDLERGGVGATNHWYVSSDPAIMDTLENLDIEDGSGREWMRAKALKPGKVTITTHAHYTFDNSITDSESMTFYVVEPPMAQMEVSRGEIRPGETMTARLNVVKDHVPVRSIEWSSENEQIATVYAEGETAKEALITGVAEGDDTRIKAVVTFEDDTSCEVYCNIHIVKNSEVWVDAKEYEIYLGTADWDYNVQTIWQTWTHNASHWDEIGKGTDQAWIEWSIDDPSIIEFIGQELNEEGEIRAPWNNGMMIRGLKEGETFVRTTLTLADKHGNYLASDTAVYPVYVHQSQAAYFASDNHDIRPGATRRIEVAVNEDSGMELKSVEFEAQNDMITVENVSADGEFAVSVTATSEDTEIGQSGVFAHVTYTDGGEDTIHFDLHLIHDEDVFIEVFPYEITLSDARFGDHPMFEEAWAYMRSNMHLTEDGGSDKLNIEWESDDIGIAYVGEKIDEHPYNNGYYVHAGRAGHTTLHAKVTVTNADDQVIAFADAEFPIEVRETKLEAGFHEDHYETLVGEDHHFGYFIDDENHKAITRRVFRSGDESIVRLMPDNQYMGVAPGETKIYMELYCGDYLVHVSEATVTVHGAGVSLSTNNLTLNVGEAAFIDTVVNLNGLEDEGHDWESSNLNVAAISHDGLVYAAAPGEAIVTYLQHTDEETFAASARVTVLGEADSFLNASALTLYPEQSYTFEFGENVDMDSLVWEIHDPDGLLTFDAETMTATANYHTDRTHTAVVTCTATVDGQQQTASCHITMPAAALRIIEHMFGQGNWHYLEREWYMDVYEQYACSDPSLAVTVEIWTDDPEIATYNAEEHRIYAHKQGDTLAHYRVSASNGESYTRSMLIRVETGEPMQSLEVRYPDYAYVVAQSDYDSWFPIITAPDYAYGRVLFSSSDEGVVSFDDGEDSSHMFFGYDHHHAGRATITARIASDEDFTLPEVRGEVLVLDEDAIELVPVDEEGNPNGDYEILPGESIQLGFVVHEGGVFWEEKDVERIEYINYYGNSQFTVTEDGLVTRTGPWSDPFNVFARVFFKSGYWAEFCCELYCPANETEYFVLMLDNDDNLLSYTNFVGTLSELPLHARFNYDRMGDITDLSFESDNEDVAVIEAFGGNPHIRCGETAGTATITGTGTFEDGREFSANFTVHTIDPTEFDIQIGSSLPYGTNIVYVGDTIEMYCGHVDEALALSGADSKRQEFITSDPSIIDTLDNLGENNGSGREWMTMRALKPGKVTITVNAHSTIHEYLTDSDSMTIYVVERPKVQMDTTSVSLRPGEKREIYANVNGDASEVIAINWYSDDESAVTVTVDEENGHHATLTGAAVSGEAESKDARVRAELTFANGDTYTVYCNVHITGNDEIWLNAKQHEMWFGTADWDCNVQTIWQIWTHNASHFDEIGAGTDQAWIDWTIDDPTIAEFVGLEKDENGDPRAPWNNGMMIRGLKEGETFVRTTLTLFDANDNVIAVDHAVYPVYVHQSYAASFDAKNFNLRPGQTREFPIAVNEDSGLVIDTVEFIPDNDMIEVTKLSADGKYAASVKAVSDEDDSGIAARITYTNGYEEEIWQWVNIVTDDEVEIEVFPYEIRLAAVDYSTIPMREEAWLGIYCPLYIEADGGTDKLWIEWWTDDPDVAYVGEKIDDNPVNNGYYIHGANPGRTTLRAKVTARNGSGDELASTVAEFPVEVVEVYFHPWADNDHYEQNVGDRVYVGFRYNEDWRTKTPVITTTSSNERVAITTPDDHVLTVGPGEATITRTYSFPGSETTFSASTDFIVSGPYTPVFTRDGKEIDSLTLAMGDEPVILGTNIDYNGSEYNDDYAFSTNEPVLNVEHRYNEETGWHDIVVTPVAPGEATVVFELNTNHGDVYAYLPVTVTGEAEFTLNKTRMTLLCEASEQLTIVTGLGEPDSIKWESNKEYVWVDEDGTVHAGENDRGETPATITCKATYGDVIYTAGCEVTVPARKLYPMERMFNNRQIFSMWVDDYQYIHESYMTTDPALEITEKIEIENPEILELTEDGKHLHALKKGDTTVTYTLSASNGEKYVRTALFRVEPDLNLTSIAPVHETFVVYQEWDQHYFPLVTDPLNLPFNGHPSDGDGPRLHFYFESSDDGILSFDHNGGSEMYFDAENHRPGRVEVTVTYADNPEISFTSDVLVLNESIEVGVVGNRNLRTFYQNDEVQLTFYPGDHGVIWEDEDVDWINWRNYYGDAFTISEDGVLKINSDWNTGDEWIHLWVDVHFKSGSSYTTCFDFRMNIEQRPKIAFLTSSVGQSAEEFNAAQSVAGRYDEGLVFHETYPDNFTEEAETVANQIVDFARDETVKAVIVAQAVPGTVAGFEEILAMCDDQGRDAPLLIACMPQEPLDELGGKADFILNDNEPNQAGGIVTTVNDWGCDMFVHISFARHMEISSISARAENIANGCEDYGITYVAETITDPANDYDAACSDTLALVEKYTAENPDKKIAFFSTNCGVQVTLQSAVLSHGNAYYPQPCCPSPYHGFGASLGLDLNCSSEEALRRIAAKLSEHGAVGRFSTWAYPVNQVLIETAGKYAMDYANGIITYRYDTDTFCQIIEDRWPNTDIAIDGNHYISLQLDPVDFADYLE